MAEYTLHCFAQSGNAYKAALMLALAGADWAPRFVDYFNGETRTPAYRAINVMGEVPVLEHGGRTLAQSGVILDYLAERFRRSARATPTSAATSCAGSCSTTTSSRATRRRIASCARSSSSPNAAVMAEFGKRAESAWGVLDRAPRRARRTSSATGSRSPTFRCAAICSGRTRSASTGMRTPASLPGSHASARHPAGAHRTI